MNPRRVHTLVVLGLVVLGGVAWLALSRDWRTATVRASGLPNDAVAVTGRDALPVASALSLVVLAAGLGVLATRGWLRRVVGLITLAAAGAAAVLVATSPSRLDDRFAQTIRESTAFTGTNAPGQSTVWAWPVLTGVTFVVAAALGVLTVVRGSQWPTMSGRYDAPTAQAEPTDLDPAEADGADVWKALDEGRDPTA